MSKYVAYPKWKYAKPASPIDNIRSVLVANEEQETALGPEWYDTATFTNNTHEETADVVHSAIPAGYEPKPYPKWLYNASVPGGRLVNDQGEEDALHDAYPGQWDATPIATDSEVQMKAFGLSEDTGLNPLDPMVSADPVKLLQQTERRDAVILDPEANTLITEDDMTVNTDESGNNADDGGTDDNKTDTAGESPTAEEVKKAAEAKKAADDKKTATAKKTAVAAKSKAVTKEGENKAPKPVNTTDNDLL